MFTDLTEGVLSEFSDRSIFAFEVYWKAEGLVIKVGDTPEAQKAYFASDQGKRAMSRYNKSELGKARQATYYASEKGRANRERKKLAAKAKRRAA